MQYLGLKLQEAFFFSLTQLPVQLPNVPLGRGDSFFGIIFYVLKEGDKDAILLLESGFRSFSERHVCNYSKVLYCHVLYDLSIFLVSLLCRVR